MNQNIEEKYQIRHYRNNHDDGKSWRNQNIQHSQEKDAIQNNWDKPLDNWRNVTSPDDNIKESNHSINTFSNHNNNSFQKTINYCPNGYQKLNDHFTPLIGVEKCHDNSYVDWQNIEITNIRNMLTSKEEVKMFRYISDKDEIHKSLLSNGMLNVESDIYQTLTACPENYTKYLLLEASNELHWRSNQLVGIAKVCEICKLFDKTIKVIYICLSKTEIDLMNFDDDDLISVKPILDSYIDLLKVNCLKPLIPDVYPWSSIRPVVVSKSNSSEEPGFGNICDKTTGLNLHDSDNTHITVHSIHQSISKKWDTTTKVKSSLCDEEKPNNKWGSSINEKKSNTIEGNTYTTEEKSPLKNSGLKVVNNSINKEDRPINHVKSIINEGKTYTKDDNCLLIKNSPIKERRSPLNQEKSQRKENMYVNHPEEREGFTPTPIRNIVLQEKQRKDENENVLPPLQGLFNADKSLSSTSWQTIEYANLNNINDLTGSRFFMCDADLKSIFNSFENGGLLEIDRVLYDQIHDTQPNTSYLVLRKNNDQSEKFKPVIGIAKVGYKIKNSVEVQVTYLCLSRAQYVLSPWCEDVFSNSQEISCLEDVQILLAEYKMSARHKKVNSVFDYVYPWSGSPPVLNPQNSNAMNVKNIGNQNKQNNLGNVNKVVEDNLSLSDRKKEFNMKSINSGNNRSPRKMNSATDLSDVNRSPRRTNSASNINTGRYENISNNRTSELGGNDKPANNRTIGTNGTTQNNSFYKTNENTTDNIFKTNGSTQNISPSKTNENTRNNRSFFGTNQNIQNNRSFGTNGNTKNNRSFETNGNTQNNRSCITNGNSTNSKIIGTDRNASNNRAFETNGNNSDSKTCENVGSTYCSQTFKTNGNSQNNGTFGDHGNALNSRKFGTNRNTPDERKGNGTNNEMIKSNENIPNNGNFGTTWNTGNNRTSPSKGNPSTPCQPIHQEACLADEWDENKESMDGNCHAFELKETGHHIPNNSSQYDKISNVHTRMTSSVSQVTTATSKMTPAVSKLIPAASKLIPAASKMTSAVPCKAPDKSKLPPLRGLFINGTKTLTNEIWQEIERRNLAYISTSGNTNEFFVCDTNINAIRKSLKDCLLDVSTKNMENIASLGRGRKLLILRSLLSNTNKPSVIGMAMVNTSSGLEKEENKVDRYLAKVSYLCLSIPTIPGNIFSVPLCDGAEVFSHVSNGLIQHYMLELRQRNVKPLISNVYPWYSSLPLFPRYQSTYATNVAMESQTDKKESCTPSIAINSNIDYAGGTYEDDLLADYLKYGQERTISFQQIEDELSEFNEKCNTIPTNINYGPAKDHVLKETVESRMQKYSSDLSRLITSGSRTQLQKSSLFYNPEKIASGVKKNPNNKTLGRGRGRGRVLSQQATPH